ncbi:MAG TPA: cytochrome P450 [Archangium sp.]|uniref:cytochrome P450 n=1 Tax=Archangium sp. TaxID=1872627 RepID=UPI002E2F3C13|nr:cytochrome P450 [Archangium sp.]HEX5753495.1 cytochrome P450 [Archangium sp.]
MSSLAPQFSPEVTLDPYPFYASLREAGPVQFVPSLMRGCYVLTHHEDIATVLKNPALFSSKLMGPGAMMPKELGEDVLRHFMSENNLLTSAPPLHTRLRNLVSRAFTMRRVAELEPRIRELSGEMLDAMLAREEFELIRELAAPLPVVVIAEMLGVEPERRLDFKRWSDDVLLTISPQRAPGELTRLRDSLLEFHAYLEAVVEQRRREPRNDLISALIEASEAEGGFLSTLDIMAFTRLLLVAGNETTTNLIGNGMVALLRHPSEWERLAADGSLIPNAVEEMLRYDSPAQSLVRVVTEDTELAGQAIPKGSRVLLLLAAANRDPRRFPEPDRFDVTREAAQGHISFGHGIHFCLGAPLARLEAKVVFEELFRRVRRVSFAPGQEGTIPWNQAFLIRGPKSLRLKAERHQPARAA